MHSPVQRAFELARSGAYATVDQIAKKLVEDGYRAADLNGPLLRRQLRKAIAEALALKPPR